MLYKSTPLTSLEGKGLTKQKEYAKGGGGDDPDANPQEGEEGEDPYIANFIFCISHFEQLKLGGLAKIIIFEEN